MAPNQVPRGIRGNNPGNIRRVDSMVWKGQEQTQTDPDFVQFVTAEYGIRAMARIFETYKRDGLNTIQAAIDRWAPPNENNTLAYIQDVCASCNMSAASVVDFSNIMPQLIKATIKHENGIGPMPDGGWYSDDQISKGIALASS